MERFTVVTMMQDSSNQSQASEYADKYLYVEENIIRRLKEGDSSPLTKLVSVVTSKDITAEQQVKKAGDILTKATEKGIEQLESLEGTLE